MAEQIRYLLHKEIDLHKWDDCIEHASNGLIYALSPYLNAMAPGWNALVLNDYEAVFPLPCRRKFRLHYVCHPPLVAQLGLFGNNISRVLFTTFLNAIPGKFVYIDLPLNFQNNFPDPHLFLRKNFVLPLDKEYNSIYDGYNKNVKRNILKAIRQDCYIEKNIAINVITALAEKQVRNRAALKAFESVFDYFHEKKQAVAYAVKSPEGETLASAAFLFSHGRAYYVLPGNHEKGRLYGASHFLIDNFIKDHAGPGLLLDFEGSDAQGVATFYASFGATDQPYSALRWNRLPAVVRWIKK
jgi:hypothetical protein